MHGSWLTQTKETRSNRGDRGRTTEVVNSAPQFTTDCPTIGGIIAAAKGSTSITVSWIDPTATDPDKDKVTITQASGNAKGSIFQEGQHTIVYLAKDSKGNKDFCFMSFTVVVSRCTPLQWPRNGHKYCDGNDYWGSTCTITCDEGYKIQGLQSLTCEQNGHYSGSTPTCSRTKCLTPDEPEHGQASCSRQDFSFGSICLSHCDYGYTATVFKFSECLENKNWSNTLSTCDDIQPPRIACPGIIKVYTDQSSDTANVTWDEPIATDNSGGDVTVQPIDDTYASGSLFPVGLTPVSYRAVDEAGNVSPMCMVMVIVENICQAGSYSLTGLSPCSHCPIGEYQFATMAQNCSVCPPGTITKTEFSKMDSECLEFDMLIYPHGVIYVDNLAETEGDGWTMATWLYFIVSTGYIHMSFDRDTSMNYSSHSLAIKMQNTTVETTMVAVIGQWHHIAVRTSATAGNIAVFVNGTLVELMDAIPANFSKVSVSHLEISYKGPEKTGVKISGFNFGTSPLTDDNILILSSSCNVFHPNARTTMNELSRGTIKDVDLIIPSECGEGDACQDQPCGNNACVTERSGYVCYCSGGFTGDHCEIPPDYCVGNMCQNGATCRSRNENYTCDCRPGYSGEMCHDAPVNGQWRQWTDWSVCNATCGGGTVTRQRFCDSPPPDEYGVHCGGYDLEYAVCNIQECPSCTELKRPYGSHLVCEKNDDMTYCNLTCRDGYTFLPGQTPKQLYDCGIQTDYKWQHTSNDNPLGDLPGCSKIGPANRLSTKTQSTYIDFSCDKEDDARTALVGNLESLPCVSNLTCSMEVAINGCDKVNRRRRATNSINSIITLTIPIEGGDLDLAAFFENKTVSDTLSQMIQAINELEMAVLALESNVHLFLDIDVDSTTYHVDSATVITIPGVDCRDGSVPVEAFCVECTPGTFYNDGRCLLCGKGMYQDQFGQSSCIQCPEEKTTPGKGSASITYCHTSKATEFTKTKKDGDSVFVTLMVIVTVVIVGLVIGCICHRKLKRAATQNKVRPKSDHPPSYDEAIAVLPKVEM